MNIQTEIQSRKRQIHNLKIAFENENKMAKAHLFEADKLQRQIEKLVVENWQAEKEYNESRPFGSRLIMTAKSSMVIVFLLISSYIFAQPTSFALLGTQAGYSAKYHAAQGGFFGGYKFNNNYVGLNATIPFTSKRSVPTATAGIEYSYSIGTIAPYITGEYYSCGKEAISEGEGTQGFDFGIGLAYYPESLPIKISIGLDGLDKLSQVKDFTNYLNVSIGGYITF